MLQKHNFIPLLTRMRLPATALAKAFYEHYGFTCCTDSPMTLYLPLG